MIPLTKGSAIILRALGLDFIKRGPLNTFRLNTPLNLKNIDQQKLLATEWSVRKTPKIEVRSGKRSDSRKTIYIDLSADNTRPAAYLAAGHKFTYSKQNIPDRADPITIEQRGNILRIQQGKSARYRDEGNRQRRDTKSRRYIQLLKLINLTYGNYTEVREVAFAWKNTNNISDFVEALAVNEAIDHMYGTRSRFLRETVNKPLRLPVGIDALSTIWRYGTSH